MKYLSFVVPSYNAEKFLDKNLSSLVMGKDDVEIIVVNDGSKDNTLLKAKEYQEKYPTIIKIIDKENGGHGSTINAALEIATGLYFKCVDADDWVDEKAYKKVLDTIKKHYEENTSPDLYVTNFVYENLELNTSVVDSHKNRFPVDKICTFKDVKKFNCDEFLMMHNMIYKLSVLKESQVKLLEHTYYVDNLFVYVPLYYVNTLYYIDADFYRYYVGRPNQSVTLENMTKNYKMQLKVIRAMSLWYTLDELNKLPRKKRNFIIHDLVINHFLTLFYIAVSVNKERKAEYFAFLKDFKERNHRLYNKVRYRSTLVLPFLLVPPLRRYVIKIGYKIICRKTHWN